RCGREVGWRFLLGSRGLGHSTMRTENPRVGGSIPPLGTTTPRKDEGEYDPGSLFRHSLGVFLGFTVQEVRVRLAGPQRRRSSQVTRVAASAERAVSQPASLGEKRIAVGIRGKEIPSPLSLSNPARG